MTQTATTGNLAEAQRIVIEQARYTAEHNAPMLQLVEHFRLGKGEKSITVPKIGQFTAVAVGDGVDIVDEQDIGMTTVSLTTSEVGMKIILTDKLVRQLSEDTFRMVGKQAGDAMARKKDGDLLALFSALNGTSDLSTSGYDMELGNVSVLIGHAMANKFPKPYSIVAHPWTVTNFVNSTFGYAGGTTGAAAGAAFPSEFSQDLLKDYFSINVGGVPIFHDGNLTVDASYDSVAAIFSKEALAYAESVNYNQETERDASLRGTELVWTSDYGVFELDDGYGAPATFRSTMAVA